jgi:hypothetical protein
MFVYIHVCVCVCTSSRLRTFFFQKVVEKEANEVASNYLDYDWKDIGRERLSERLDRQQVNIQ